MNETRADADGVSPALSTPLPLPAGPALFEAPLAAELTLGLLHNANNAMTGLYFTIESFLDEPACPPETRQQLHDALASLHATRAILDRTTELHLALREPSYHEAGELLRRQLDLLKIALPQNTTIENQPAPENLHLHIDEAGFRRLFVGIVHWLRPALQRRGTAITSVRAANHPVTSAPAIAFSLAAAAELPSSPPPQLDAAAYGGHVTAHRLPVPGQVELALFLPRVELSAAS